MNFLVAKCTDVGLPVAFEQGPSQGQ